MQAGQPHCTPVTCAPHKEANTLRTQVSTGRAPHARQALASALSEWVKCEQGFLADKATVILSEVAGVTERPLGLEASSVSCCLCDLRKVTMPFFSFWPLIM